MADRRLREVAIEVLKELGASEVEKTANEVVASTISHGWNSYINLVGAREENVLLKSQVKVLEAKNVALREAGEEIRGFGRSWISVFRASGAEVLPMSLGMIPRTGCRRSS